MRNNYNHFNKKDISLQLQTHPNNPSFRSMTDTLDYFEIENVAAKVPEEALDVLPKDFLTTIGVQDPQLVLATKKNSSIVILNEDGQKSKYSLSEFKEIWTKNIIAIEKTKIKNSLTIIRNFWITLPLILLPIFVVLTSDSLIQIIIIALAGIGVLISYLLVKEQIGFHSKTVHNVCTSLTNSNCNDVINSEGGKITENISLADASLLYFLVLFLSSIFLGSNLIIFVIILVALPVIGFSLYYQGFVLKQWCVLCLGVVLILGLLNIITLFWNFNTNINLSAILVFLIIVSFTIPLYFYIKDFIESNKTMEQELISAKTFKRNPKIVKNILADAEVVQNTIILEDEIIIGNKNATHQITTYTNPLCGFCKKAFESYVKIINANSNVKILIRFSTNPSQLESPSTQISSRLIEIYHEKGSEAFIGAYNSWFKDKDINRWLQKQHNPKFGANTLLLLNYQNQWAEENKIEFTPTTIISNKVFPSSYGYDDLVYVIDDILMAPSKN